MSASRNRPPSLWWESLPDDIECAITLEPINSLGHPPFLLRKQKLLVADNDNDNGDDDFDVIYYFDGLALASYIVSRGIFQNPLTRDPLNWDDCRRLDQYLEDYCAFDNYSHQQPGAAAATTNNRRRVRRFQVLEAFALRESVRVRQPVAIADGGAVATQQVDEARQRRADVLRSEATTALSGLFQYGTAASGSNPARHRRGRQPGQPQQQFAAWGPAPAEPDPTFGFNLHAQDNSNDTANDNNEDDGYGMLVIDDDDQVRVESEQHAYQQLQEAFPHLSTQDEDYESTKISEAVATDEERLGQIRAKAARDQQQEWVREQALQYARQQLEQEAHQRKINKQQERVAARVHAEANFKTNREDLEEGDRARAEIEQWRALQWDRMSELANQQQHQDREQKKKETEELKLQQQLIDEVNTNEEKQQQEEMQQQEALDAEAKQKAVKAAKKKRAKERKKNQKAQERQEQEQRDKAAALRAEKAASANKCGACSSGIVGCGFEKFGHQFCSTKCARAGPS